MGWRDCDLIVFISVQLKVYFYFILFHQSYINSIADKKQTQHSANMQLKSNPFLQKYKIYAPPLFLNYGQNHLTVYKALTKLPITKKYSQNLKIQQNILLKMRNKAYRTEQKPKQTEFDLKSGQNIQSQKQQTNLFWKNLPKSNTTIDLRNPFQSVYHSSKHKKQVSVFQRQMDQTIKKQKNEKPLFRQQMQQLQNQIRIINNEQEKQSQNFSVIKLYKQKNTSVVKKKNQERIIEIPKMELTRINKLQITSPKYPPRDKNKMKKIRSTETC